VRITRRALAPLALAAAALPAQAASPPWIDAHTHAFVRGLKLAVDARYAPTYDASWETLLKLAEANGVGRTVLLQPSFLGYDNSYLFGALKAEPHRFRGVPWVSPSIETRPEEWEEMARIGVRGLRFPILGLPTPQWSAYREMFAEALKRDWPIHLYVESRRLPEMLPFLLDAGHKVVIPHYGMFDRTWGRRAIPASRFSWRAPGPAASSS